MAEGEQHRRDHRRGLAGAKAAETLREGGFDGRIVLIGEEAERPSDRPSLSKDEVLGAFAAHKDEVVKGLPPGAGT